MEVTPLKRVAFYTLGCKTNQYDTEAMQEQFLKHDYSVVDFESDADVYIINTCTVTNLSDRKSRQMIRKAHRKNPDAIIAVVGCYAQRASDEILDIPGVSVVVGTNDRVNIVDYVEKAHRDKRMVNAVGDIMGIRDFEETPIEFYEGRTRAILKIQEGCSQYCSYCVIPYARGPIRSRKPDSVKAEVERLAQRGFKEVVLTGIHIASYGKELSPRTDLRELLRLINDVPGIKRIRLGSLEPTLLTDGFIDTVSKLPKVCQHYHISLQSGCDATLKRMNRRYTTGQYREIVEKLRSAMPDVAVTTDIMAGFPGETDEEFEATLSFIKSIGFSRIHVFQYSPRQGTPAADYPDQVPAGIKEKRSRRISDLGHEMESSYLKRFSGRVETVLFEKESAEKEGYFEGYTEHYIRVLAPAVGDIINCLHPVRIEKVNDMYLEGVLVSA